MKRISILLALCLSLVTCQETTNDDEALRLQGAWLLRRAEYPMGDGVDFSTEGNGTFCSIYEGDSVLYEYRLTTTPSGLVVMPTGKVSITFIDHGGGQIYYLEGGDPHPLQIDSTITIQRCGVQYIYERADSLYQEWGEELRDITARELDAGTDADRNRYVLSVKERQQERSLQRYAYFSGFILLVVLFMAHLILTSRRARQRLQLQLQQIQEVQEHRPAAVRQAVETEENAYFASDEYAALQRRMASGQRMKEEEQADVEQQLKVLYPGVTSQLRGLYPMSELELQVCQLIKLRIPPKDIAAVLSRDMSTISTVRSRLFKKVFGRKGGAKEWDDFIMTL